MPKLNQIIAVEKGKKALVENEVTKAYHLIQKSELFAGHSRVYTPLDDEGEKLPGESVLVVVQAPDLVGEFAAAQAELFDVTATKVYGNTGAKADVVVDGVTVLADVPVEYLLFLEKRLNDVQTFLAKLPVLDPAIKWTRDETNGYYVSEPVRTQRSKKVKRVLQKAKATDKHPEQVEVYDEDMFVGTWETTRYSGAVPATVLAEWKRRTRELQAAVLFAREQANSIEVQQVKTGDAVFQHLFGPAK